MVELVYERFRDLSGIELAHRTHEEAPWQQATERSHDGGDDIVTHEQMRLYYRDRLAVLAESAEFPPLEPVIDLGSLGGCCGWDPAASAVRALSLWNLFRSRAAASSLPSMPTLATNA